MSGRIEAFLSLGYYNIGYLQSSICRDVISEEKCGSYLKHRKIKKC